MEPGTRLAIEAIVMGLRNAGMLHDHAMHVIIDELRTASRRARELLHDQAGDQIERLAQTLHADSGLERCKSEVARQPIAGGQVPSEGASRPRVMRDMRLFGFPLWNRASRSL